MKKYNSAEFIKEVLNKIDNMEVNQKFDILLSDTMEYVEVG